MLNLRFVQSTVFNPIFNPSFLWCLGSYPILNLRFVKSTVFNPNLIILVSLQATFTKVLNHLKLIKSTLTLLMIVPDIGPVQTLNLGIIEFTTLHQGPFKTLILSFLSLQGPNQTMF